MTAYKNLDTLYEFLKNIRTVEEFFEKKEPRFDDAISREMAYAMMEDGTSPEDMLSALKSEERQAFAAEFKERCAPN